jgi:DNA-binding MarR family transcriptional regulator
MVDNRCGFLISQIKQLQDRVFETLLRHHGLGDLNGPQGRILFVLWGQDGISITALGRQTSLAKTSLTGMLDRMEAKGLVERRSDPADRRQLRIGLTARARSLGESYRQVSRSMGEVFFPGFSDTEVQNLESMLDRILTNLQSREEAQP